MVLARYVPHLPRYVLTVFFWFDRVMDKTCKVLPRNGCAGMYF